MRRFTAPLFWLYALLIIQSCTKEFTGGKDTIEYQYSIENNTEESIILNMYNCNNTSILGLHIPGNNSFEIGSFSFAECDSLDVFFDDTKCIRLYSAHYLYSETDITPSYDNCFNKYVSTKEEMAKKVFSIDYKMKSFAK